MIEKITIVIIFRHKTPTDLMRLCSRMKSVGVMVLQRRAISENFYFSIIAFLTGGSSDKTAAL